MDVEKRELRVSLDRESMPVAFNLFEKETDERSTPDGRNYRLANISRSGMFIENRGDFEPKEGSSVRFALQVDPQRQVTGVAQVRWVRSKMLGPYLPRGLGLQVLEFHENAEPAYLDFLEHRLVNLKITDLMDPEPLAVDGQTAVRDVVAFLVGGRRDGVVVTGSGAAPAGIFTKTDILTLINGGRSLDVPVKNAMTRDPIAIETSESMEDAYNVLRYRGLQNLPVVEKGTLVGMLTTRDLIPYWSELMDLQAKRLTQNYNKAMSVIAHDLRTPLSVIQSTNRLLTSGELNPEEYVSTGLPGVIEDRCEMMMGLVDEILDINKIKEGRVRLEPRPVDVVMLAHKTAQCFEAAAHAKGIGMSLQTPQDTARITADPLRLEQVLNNLISNALKFSADGGQVTVGVRAKGEEEVELWVQDCGPGIPEQDRPNLFEAYGPTSIKPTAGESSTGLGLAITKNIVEAHGGTITVDTEPGRGSTFTVALPVGGAEGRF